MAGGIGMDDFMFDKKAPLIGCDRTKIEGFKKYFSKRKRHFRDIFHMIYSDETAALAFREANDLRKSLNSTIFSTEDM